MTRSVWTVLKRTSSSLVSWRHPWLLREVKVQDLGPEHGAESLEWATNIVSVNVWLGWAI